MQAWCGVVFLVFFTLRPLDIQGRRGQERRRKGDKIWRGVEERRKRQSMPTPSEHTPALDASVLERDVDRGRTCPRFLPSFFPLHRGHPCFFGSNMQICFFVGPITDTTNGQGQGKDKAKVEIHLEARHKKTKKKNRGQARHQHGWMDGWMDG